MGSGHSADRVVTRRYRALEGALRSRFSEGLLERCVLRFGLTDIHSQNRAVATSAAAERSRFEAGSIGPPCWTISHPLRDADGRVRGRHQTGPRAEHAMAQVGVETVLAQPFPRTHPPLTTCRASARMISHCCPSSCWQPSSTTSTSVWRGPRLRKTDANSARPATEADTPLAPRRRRWVRGSRSRPRRLWRQGLRRWRPARRRGRHRFRASWGGPCEACAELVQRSLESTCVVAPPRRSPPRPIADGEGRHRGVHFRPLPSAH